MEEYRRHTISLDILDELAARFIINIPLEERRDLIRVCFQIELAHWFYIDFYVDSVANKKLKPDQRLQSGTMKEFAAHIFMHVPFLQCHANRVEEVMEEWREYKLAVPTFGAIIINPFLDKVLLVQGYMAKSSWGFPKGKVNEDEPAHLCAAREVLEETGFDVGPLLEENEYLEQVINDQTVRLYLIQGVPESTSFAPQTRCEIRDLQWFEINTLPMSRSDMVCKNKLGIAANSFFMVIPFVRELKQWVKNKRMKQANFHQEAAPQWNPQWNESQNMDGKMRTKIAERLKKKPAKAEVARVNSGKKNSDAKRENEQNHPAVGKQRKDSDKNAPPVGRQRKESEEKNPTTNANPSVGRQRKESEKNLVQSSTAKQKKVNKKNSRTELEAGQSLVNQMLKNTEDNVEKARLRTEEVMSSKFFVGEKGKQQELGSEKQARRQLFMSLVPPPNDTKTKHSKEELNSQLIKPIFDENFCPTAWSNFSLNYEEIMEPYDNKSSMPTSGQEKSLMADLVRQNATLDQMAASMGLPTSFKGHGGKKNHAKRGFGKGNNQSGF